MHLLLQAISGSKELTSIIFNLRCHNRNHCPQINCAAPPGIPAASGWGSAHSAPALSGLALLSASCRKYYLHLDRPSLRFEASRYWTGAGTTIGKRVSLQGTCTISFLQILCGCLDFSAGFLQSLCIESFRKSSVHACQGPGCARIHPFPGVYDLRQEKLIRWAVSQLEHIPSSNTQLLADWGQGSFLGVSPPGWTLHIALCPALISTCNMPAQSGSHGPESSFDSFYTPLISIITGSSM